MIGRFKLENPEKMEATLTVTMTLKDWETFRDQLTSKWPSCDFVAMVNDVLSQARKTYWPKDT